jgi:HlyD family secretion protein
MLKRSDEADSSRRWRWVAVVAVPILLAAGLALLPRVRALSSVSLAEPPPVSAPAPPQAPLGVAALGRIEPLDGILRVAGPSSPSTQVVKRLLVDEGDRVEAGQLLAALDTEIILAATVRELEAELEYAERERERSAELRKGLAASEATLDTWSTRVSVGRAKLARARAELERARVVSPFAGLVLEVHARPGERIGPEGILELARVDQMYAIAEVYETDVARVRPGQRARVRSPALPHPLGGEVEWVRPKVQKQDEIGTDPAARKDARVIEVKVRLDDSATAAPFTLLQVEVEIEP